MSENYISVNSTGIPELNVSAIITFVNITYSSPLTGTRNAGLGITGF